MNRLVPQLDVMSVLSIRHVIVLIRNVLNEMYQNVVIDPQEGFVRGSQESRQEVKD